MDAAQRRRWVAAATASALLLFANLGCAPSTTPQAAAARVPELLTPAPDAVVDNGRTDGYDEIVREFTWTACPGAVMYELQLGRTDPTSALPVLRVATNAHRTVDLGGYVAEHNLSGWRWRVRALVGGAWQPWSEERAFTVEPRDTDPPQPELVTPRLLEPAADAVLEGPVTYPADGTTWAFRWRRVPVANAYRLVVSAPHRSAPVAEGAVAADGSFAIGMPALVLPRGLAAGGRLDAGVELSGSFRYLYVVGFVLMKDGVEVGTALLGTSPAVADLWWAPRGAARGEAAALWWYADRAASMHGERDVYRFDLDLPGGWSRVLLRVASGRDDPTPFEVRLTVVDDFPTDLAWHWTRSGAP